MKILIIEDDEGIRELLRDELEEYGHKTFCVQSGKEAAAWLENHSAYLMLLDYGLPDMNGKELINELKKKTIPIPDFIVATGQGDERIAVDMMKLGARDYVIKDAHFIDMLIQAVARVNKEIENENKLKAAEKALSQMEDKLRQAHKMEAIGTITGGIAHDFNNILSIIIGNTELAMDNIPQWHPAYLNLHEIKNAGMRAADIVKQLLSFTRKTGQALKPVKIIPVIRDSIHMVKSAIALNVEMQINIFDSGQTVLANPAHINQAVMNLCINASQAMEDTGGILNIIVENIIIDTPSNNFPELQAGEYIKIIVKDTGSGINPDIMNRIFDPYFTTKEVGKGSGMGLAVVYGIVINHRGCVNVDSQSGSGACFSILLPLVK
ncbi:Two component system response regulator/histidine kinase [Desulfonema limicola]|uniref:histidine kinase n=1 Tax=Desulfonema limicola TaxID=45656 RepID=A0A975B6U1_9BACT|nr:response regulator [Desulfonema limicola]QTA79742.1 Two component system response regulator/histidine kinase [Desulfonema limicola]